MFIFNSSVYIYDIWVYDFIENKALEKICSPKIFIDIKQNELDVDKIIFMIYIVNPTPND